MVDAKVAAEASGPPIQSWWCCLHRWAGKDLRRSRVLCPFAAEQPSGTRTGHRSWSPTWTGTGAEGPKAGRTRTFEVSNSTNMLSLWWGVSCQERQDDRLERCSDDIGQLVAHFRPALNKLEANRATAPCGTRPSENTYRLCHSAMSGILDGLDNFDKYPGPIPERNGTANAAPRRIDPSENDGSLIETWAGAIGCFSGLPASRWS